MTERYEQHWHLIIDWYSFVLGVQYKAERAVTMADPLGMYRIISIHIGPFAVVHTRKDTFKHRGM